MQLRTSERIIRAELPCTRIFENSQKNLRRARIKKILRKWQAQQGKNLVFQKKIRDSGSLPTRILGSPSGKLDPQVTHCAHTRTFQSIHALPELSCPLPVSELYGSSRSVRARPATAPAAPDGEQRCRLAAAAIPAPDFPDAGHQAAPDALDDGARCNFAACRWSLCASARRRSPLCERARLARQIQRGAHRRQRARIYGALTIASVSHSLGWRESVGRVARTRQVVGWR